MKFYATIRNTVILTIYRGTLARLLSIDTDVLRILKPGIIGIEFRSLTITKF